MDSRLIDIAERHSRRLDRIEKKTAAQGRPAVTLKLATSLDGRIATQNGDSKWITGETARLFTHLLRADHDAVMVGIGTALFDDPELTCRVPGFEKLSPARIVVDSDLRLPLSSKLVTGAAQTPLILATVQSNADITAPFENSGVTVLSVDATVDGQVDLPLLMKRLFQRNISHILVEGGGQLAASLIKARLVDLVVWFQAAKVIGADGKPSIHNLGVDVLEEAPEFRRLDIEVLDEDWVIFMEAVR